MARKAPHHLFFFSLLYILGVCLSTAQGFSAVRSACTHSLRHNSHGKPTSRSFSTGNFHGIDCGLFQNSDTRVAGIHIAARGRGSHSSSNLRSAQDILPPTFTQAFLLCYADLMKSWPLNRCAYALAPCPYAMCTRKSQAPQMTAPADRV